MARTAANPLDQYKKDLSRLPASQLLGVMVWYSITGEVERLDGKRVSAPVRVSREFLAEQFEQRGLDERLLPPPIRKYDAFRQASSEIKAEYPLPRNADRTATIRVVELDTDKDTITRLILRDVRDRRTKNVSTTVVGEMKFWRGDPSTRNTPQSGETVKVRINTQLREVGIDMKETGQQIPFDPQEKELVEDLVATFKKRYADLSVNYSAQAIRAIIRNYVTHLNAIACKPTGGIYFVHMERIRQVAALEGLVEAIGQGCTFHSLPLEDTNKQRNMLTEAFQNEVQDECDLLLVDIAKVRAKGKVAPEKFAEFHRRLSVITARSREYTDKLGLAQERSGDAIIAAMEEIDGLESNLTVKTSRK